MGARASHGHTAAERQAWGLSPGLLERVITLPKEDRQQHPKPDRTLTTPAV